MIDHPFRKIDLSGSSWYETRLFRVLLFFIITWAVASSFVALDILLARLFMGVVNNELVSAQMTLPSPSKADCRSAIEQALTSAPDSATIQQATFNVWRLGFDVGFATGLRNASSSGSKNTDIEKLMENSGQQAETLGVIKPKLPALAHIADALHEFEVFVEHDPDCIGTQLGSRFSSRHTSLYKFALSMGHAAVYRILAPKLGPIFVAQIRHYGQLARIPPELSEPLLSDSLNNLSVENANDKVRTLLAKVEQYIQLNP